MELCCAIIRTDLPGARQDLPTFPELGKTEKQLIPNEAPKMRRGIQSKRDIPEN